MVQLQMMGPLPNSRSNRGSIGSKTSCVVRTLSERLWTLFTRSSSSLAVMMVNRPRWHILIDFCASGATLVQYSGSRYSGTFDVVLGAILLKHAGGVVDRVPVLLDESYSIHYAYHSQDGLTGPQKREIVATVDAFEAGLAPPRDTLPRAVQPTATLPRTGGASLPAVPGTQMTHQRWTACFQLPTEQGWFLCRFPSQAASERQGRPRIGLL